MAKISMDLLKELREKTQVGMMDCKKALEETGGDIEKAIEILRKKGAAVAAKRADNATDNGRIEACIADNFKSGSLVEIGCETDFSANNENMKNFALDVAQEANKTSISNPEQLVSESKKISDHLHELLAKITEKIIISKIATFTVERHGIVNHYIHPGSTIGVLIEFTTEKEASADLDELKTTSRDICMHIAVKAPLSLSPDDLDQALIEKERSIFTEQLKATGKPENIIGKIVEGKIGKYYSEVCLLSQSFIKNEDLTIQKYLDALSSKIGNKVTVKQFVRFSIGK